MLPATNLSAAVVVIGRNEGARLGLSLRSALAAAEAVVYVDSGSTDGSLELAHGLGCAVHALSADRPFSAARARNEGFARLMEMAPSTEYVQFLDGDCTLETGWLETGAEALDTHADVAMVRGRVVESHPEKSVYNRLCHLEWQQAPGEVDTCGGRFLIRAQVYRQMEGMHAGIVGGEDDEFCLRVRESGWKILMLAAAMGEHDAAILRFGQWWRRMRRTGHAFGEVANLHPAWRYFRREQNKIWIWGLTVPLAGLLLAFWMRGGALVVVAGLYGVQCAWIYCTVRGRGWSASDRWTYAFFVTLSRLPALLGLLQYFWKKRRGDTALLIEYK